MREAISLVFVYLVVAYFLGLPPFQCGYKVLQFSRYGEATSRFFENKFNVIEVDAITGDEDLGDL